MKKAEVLRERARLLRQLAVSFDDPCNKEDLLNLAERCERLAAYIVARLTETAAGRTHR